MFVPEKSYECGKINSSLLTTDHGTHYWCKCVIEWKPFMFFIWWTSQEIRHTNTTCNAPEDGIWIADHVTICQSCVGISRNNRSTWVGSLWGKYSTSWNLKAGPLFFFFPLCFFPVSCPPLLPSSNCNSLSSPTLDVLSFMLNSKPSVQ